MYHMELVSSDAELIINAVNQGIDSHLQAVTESTFVVDGHRLVCDVSPNDLRVIVRRLLENEDMESEMLVSSICETLGIEEIALSINDDFMLDYHDQRGYEEISVFDSEFWPNLVDRE